jgi:hypothetical protein
VVLSSPYPVDECLRRLAQVTTTRMPTSWYLDSRTAVRPDPRFWGDVSPSGISVVQFAEKTGRASFAPQLRVRPEPAAGERDNADGNDRDGAELKRRHAGPDWRLRVPLSGLQSLKRNIPRLIEDANKTLGSTATFPDQVDDTIGARRP